MDETHRLVRQLRLLYHPELWRGSRGLGFKEDEMTIFRRRADV